MERLLIIVANAALGGRADQPTGRAGPAIGRWFQERAQRSQLFETQIVDLADTAAPLAALAYAADPFVCVTPEHNFGAPPMLEKALSELTPAFAYKPVGFVSYGGPFGGSRAVQVIKQIVSGLRMVPLIEGVTITQFIQHLDGTGAFAGKE